MKIAINGGHYPGLDSGAVGDRITESEVTKDVMYLVCTYLRKVGYEVIAIQENELYNVVWQSNQFESELFVSIHCNGSVIGTACGTEVHYIGNEGEQLAQCIQSQLTGTLKTTDRGIKKSENLYVLKYTDCPAVLVEMAFITNREDEDLLISHQDDFAKAIARGITDYVAMLNKNLLP